MQATEWVKLFLSLGGIEEGYGKANITPYMHILCYHIPHFLRQEICIKRFTGQGIEKINDIVRSIYHKKCNKHDACKEALQALKRVDRLQGYAREPTKYDKVNSEYWGGGITEQRKKKIRLSVEPREEIVARDEINVDELGVGEIKAKLKDMGITTRVRNLDKLREMLRNALLSQ